MHETAYWRGSGSLLNRDFGSVCVPVFYALGLLHFIGAFSFAPTLEEFVSALGASCHSGLVYVGQIFPP
jgi:hypothetical protein